MEQIFIECILCLVWVDWIQVKLTVKHFVKRNLLNVFQLKCFQLRTWLACGGYEKKTREFINLVFIYIYVRTDWALLEILFMYMRYMGNIKID